MAEPAFFDQADDDGPPARLTKELGRQIPRRLVGVTRHQVSLVEEEPSSELLSSDRRRHRDVETVVSSFHPCDAEDEASARGEPHQIAAVNLPVQQ